MMFAIAWSDDATKAIDASNAEETYCVASFARRKTAALCIVSEDTLIFLAGGTRDTRASKIKT